MSATLQASETFPLRAPTFSVAMVKALPPFPRSKAWPSFTLALVRQTLV